MKKWTVLLMICGVLVGLAAADGDVTLPGDPVIGQPNNNRWPDGERPALAIDNDINTKFLHFRDQETSGEVGIIITPSVGATVVQGLALASANDASGRDPISFVLYGSNGSADLGPWTQIAAGPIPDFDGESAWPRRTPTETPMRFINNTSYKFYRLMFPDMRGGINELFQVAEIELLEKPANGWAPYVLLDTDDALLKLPTETTLAIDATISDIDSSSWTYAWTLYAGPAAVDFGGTEANEDAVVTFPSVRGDYVLLLEVTDDTDNVSSKQVRVRVWDPAIDEQLVSHWTFDVENGSTQIDDLAGDNDRGYTGNYNDEHSDPNFTPGWVTLDGAALNNAADFHDAGYIEVIPDVNSIYDPNLVGLDAGVSVAAWVYANDWSGNRRVLQYGNNVNDDGNIFRMLHEWGELKFDSAPGRVVTAGIFLPGEWHHMVGTYDGFTATLYIDGVEVASETWETYVPMRPFEDQTLTIGAKNKFVDYGAYPGDYMSGRIDDLRVYSYAIDTDTVRSLVALGQQSAPGFAAVNVPEEIILTSETVDAVIDVEVYDAHGDVITYLWAQQIIGDEPAVAFSSTTVEDPTVTFSEPGTYTLRLTINDGVYGMEGTLYRDIVIVVSDANCEKVKLDGLLMQADVNEDCYVNLADVAMMAEDWLECNDPQNVECLNPYLAQ